MKPGKAISLSVLFILAVAPLASWGGYNGRHTGPGSRTHFRRYHVGARYFTIYDSAIPVGLTPCPNAYGTAAPVAQAQAPATAPVQSSSAPEQSDKAVSYTSDGAPMVPVGTSDGIEQLFYSYKDDTYWLISSQTFKGITKDQASEYIQKHPAQFRDTTSDYAPAPAVKSQLTGRDAAIEMITSKIPATITVPDTSKPPGWADYDGDGIIDEVFPQEKVIPNPDFITALRYLGAQPDSASVDDAAVASAEDESSSN